MTEYYPRIYPYPSIVKCCANCPAFKREPKSKNFKIYCDVMKIPISLEQFEQALNGEFPEFCELPLATGRNILKLCNYNNDEDE